jgi:hypothetical protein
MQTEETYRLLITYDSSGTVADVQKLGVKSDAAPDIK